MSAQIMLKPNASPWLDTVGSCPPSAFAMLNLIVYVVNHRKPDLFCCGCCSQYLQDCEAWSSLSNPR